MNKETAEFLVEATENAGNQEADLRESYSGRGMYGRETCAVVVDNYGQLLADVLQYVRDHTSDIEEDGDGTPGYVEYVGKPIPDIEGAFRQDNMGRGVVIY